MPYTRRRRTYKKRRPARTTYVRKVARQEAVKAARKQVETKFFDGGVTSNAIDWSATNSFYSMTYNPLTASNITQGVGDDQYLGSKIRPVYLTLRGVVYAGESYNTVRCILLQHKCGSSVTPAEVLESISNIRAPFSPLEREYNDTFHIIFDRSFHMDQVAKLSIPFKFKVPRRRMRPITFRGNAGSVEANGLYLLFISDSGTTPHPTITFTWRLSYKDA